MRDVDGVVGQSGAVSVVQRVNSDLRLNPHLHSVVLDGVFVADSGSPVFHPLSHLEDSDLADLLQVIRVRVLGFLERRGIIENRHELMLLDDDFAEREPALAQRLTISNGCCGTYVNLSNRRNGHPLGTRRTSGPRYCGASSHS
jgi:hypothetical protein